MNPGQEPLELIRRYIDGTASEADRDALQSLLRSDPEMRRLFARYASLDAALGSGSIALKQDGVVSVMPATSRWLSWRPLTAAAAGIVFGMLCTSVVLAYVIPAPGARIAIFSDGFESGAQPVVDGQQPAEAGHWGGDFTEVVGRQGGVQAADGKQMLRFVRADHAGSHLPLSFSSDVFQLLDLRPYKRELAAGTAVVRLSASFNGETPEQAGPFSCVLMLYALDEAFVEERQVGRFTGSIRERMLAHSSSTRVRLDSDPRTWQKAGNELRVPPGTDYLMIQVGMTNDSREPEQRKDTFAGHYADEVHVVLAHLPQITTP